MTASIINGKLLALQIGTTIKNDAKIFTTNMQRPPGLAVILVGEDQASCIYVKNKRSACLNLGFNSFDYNLSSETSEPELLSLIDMLNKKNDVDGILVQLPLPKHINTNTILESISPTKDVDGFHPYNFGCLAQGRPTLRPCTPFAVIKLLQAYNIPLVGKHAVIIGASNIVGRPMALEFLLAKATVTICHSATQELRAHIHMADIIVAATGHLDIVKTEWLHKKQVIIDIGIHRMQDGTIRGDIDFNTAKDKVAWITPVPGGVGPMTICMLLQNTLFAAQQNSSRKDRPD